MARKHPKRKQAIVELTAAEPETLRKGLSREVFGDKLRELKHDIAPGLGCLRNEYLLTLNLNPERQ